MPRKQLKIAGFGVPLAAAMRAKRFWRDDDQPDVIGFSLAARVLHSSVYRWLAGEIPRPAILFQIAKALDVDPKEDLLDRIPPKKTGRRALTCLVIWLTTGGVLLNTPDPTWAVSTCFNAAYRQSRRWRILWSTWAPMAA